MSLVGVPGNEKGIGAIVELFASNFGKQRRDIFGPIGYASHRAPKTHFGLGSVPQIDFLRVQWPDGEVSVLADFRPTDINRNLMVKHPIFERSDYLAGAEKQVEFHLSQGFPNPFNLAVAIPFSVAADGLAKLEVFNVAGQDVRVLLDEELRAGHYCPFWDGTDDNGLEVSSGVYVYRLQAGNFERSRRLLLSK